MVKVEEKYIAERFGDWEATHTRRYNQSEIAEAVFNKHKRSDILSEGLDVKELNNEPNVWWVNQGMTLPDEKQGGYLWAPFASKDGRTMYFWDTLDEVQEGDIVLHYADGALRCVSQVQAAAVIAEKPHASVDGDWEKEGRLVRTAYYNLEPPIARDAIASDLLKLDLEQGPLDRRGHVKQGYLFRFTHEALALIVNQQPDATWPGFVTALSPQPSNPQYPLSACAAATGFNHTELAHWVRAIERKKQAILYGPPGTGKTYLARHLARHLIGGSDGFTDLVQFHPAYAYEDFVQGMRPTPSNNGGLRYPVVPGRFLTFCHKARQRQGTCVLIIDEINRANLARVFGELMYLLEYRDQAIALASGGRFEIPQNVRIIGTMNTADRSTALVDHALRRRFAFIKLVPNYEVLRRYHRETGYPVDNLIAVLQEINAQIGDEHYHLGITFFLHNELAVHLEGIWRMEIVPYLEEYFFDQPDTAKAYTWDNVKSRVLP